MSKREPRTSKGIRAKDLLIEKAEELFYQKGYFQTSIPAIVKEARLSVPSFYQYFKNKEDVLLEIVSVLSKEFLGELRKSLENTDNTEIAIHNFYKTFLTFLYNNKKKYKIFRETEFAGYSFVKDFYIHLTDLVKEFLYKDIPSDKLKDDLSYTLIGSAYFVALKKIDWESSSNIDFLADNLIQFFLKGIDKKRNYVFSPAWKERIEITSQEQVLTRGERTQKDILKAAEKLFGNKGFWETHISDITNDIDIGQGTFYLYFDSKIELLSKLVKEINRGLRYTVYQYIKEASDRREIEVKGLVAFSDYIIEHKNAYRVVREAEFVDREIGKWYYNRVVEPYAIKLKEAIEKGEVSSIDPEILALAIIGVGHFLGLRWVVWNNDNNKGIPSESLYNTLKIILWGAKNEKN